MIGEQDFRQKIAAFDEEEAQIALEILFIKYPQLYFTTLIQGYNILMSDNEHIKHIIDSRKRYNDIITGVIADPMLEEYKPDFPPNDPDKRELVDPLYQDSLENGVELTDEEDDFSQYMNPPTEIKVPKFLKEKTK